MSHNITDSIKEGKVIKSDKIQISKIGIYYNINVDKIIETIKKQIYNQNSS